MCQILHKLQDTSLSRNGARNFRNDPNLARKPKYFTFIGVFDAICGVNIVKFEILSRGKLDLYQKLDWIVNTIFSFIFYRK